MSLALKGRIFSEEHKRKIGDANRRRIITDETRMKLGLAKKGNQYCLGRIYSEETKRKIGIKSAQKVFSKETRELHRINATGERNNFYGKKHSGETKLKMRNAWIKRKTN